MPANTQVSVIASGTQQQNVQWVAGGSGSPSTTAATKTLIVTVTGTGAFTFRGHNAPTGAVSGAGITVPFS